MLRTDPIVSELGRRAYPGGNGSQRRRIEKNLRLHAVNRRGRPLAGGSESGRGFQCVKVDAKFPKHSARIGRVVPSLQNPVQ